VGQIEGTCLHLGRHFVAGRQGRKDIKEEKLSDIVRF